MYFRALEVSSEGPTMTAQRNSGRVGLIFALAFAAIIVVAYFAAAVSSDNGSPSPRPSSDVQRSERERQAGVTDDDVRRQFGPDAGMPVCADQGHPNNPSRGYTPTPGVDPVNESTCRADLSYRQTTACTFSPATEPDKPPCPRPS